MATIAIIGGDGAGKTTIGKMLEESFPLQIKYIYMGNDPRVSRFSLPTTRLIYHHKIRSYEKYVSSSGQVQAKEIPADYLEYSPKKKGPIWTIFRYLNRLLEAWYRLFVSFSYQICGFIVVYDRHPLFDSAPLRTNKNKSLNSQIERLYHWIMSHLFPKPGVTIYLDAPAEILLK